jgi:hypothetical protein
LRTERAPASLCRACDSRQQIKHPDAGCVLIDQASAFSSDLDWFG